MSRDFRRETQLRIIEIKNFKSHLEDILNSQKLGNSTTEENIEQLVLVHLYNKIQMLLTTKLGDVEILGNLARSILEIELIVKWLRQGYNSSTQTSQLKNYQRFKIEAQQGNIDLMKSMQPLLVAEAKSNEHRRILDEEFSKNLTELQPETDETKNKAISPLKDPKKIASTLGMSLRFNAYYEMFSKVSHPTPWVICLPENKSDADSLRYEAVAAIEESLNEIKDRVQFFNILLKDNCHE